MRKPVKWHWEQVDGNPEAYRCHAFGRIYILDYSHSDDCFCWCIRRMTNPHTHDASCVFGLDNDDIQQALDRAQTLIAQHAIVEKLNQYMDWAELALQAFETHGPQWRT